MAMIDYGAAAKKNGKLVTNDMFNNLSSVSGGVLHEEYEDILFDGDTEPTHTLTVHEYVGDESIRLDDPDDESSTRSVIHNSFVTIGDEEYLIGFYKLGIYVYDKEKNIFSDTWRFLCSNKMRLIVELPFGTIKLKKIDGTQACIASFWYKDDYYEVLYGYGVDQKDFIFSKDARVYFLAKPLRKIRRWFKKGM